MKNLRVKLLSCFSLCIGLFSFPLFSAAAPGRHALREADMGVYTVITDVSPNEAQKWIAEFDQFRRAVQSIMAIDDSELLPLTVMLLADPDEFRELVPAHLSGPMQETAVLAVGLNRQPMLVTSTDNRGSGTEERIRSGVVMWLLSSAALVYDPWIVQGCIDFFSAMEIKHDRLRITRAISPVLSHLKRTARNSCGMRFVPGQGTLETGYAWAALHYLLVEQQGWTGTAALRDFQMRVNRGGERSRCFPQAFGLSIENAEREIEAFIKKGRVTRMELPAPKPADGAVSEFQPMAPGMRECLYARVLLQLADADIEVIRAHLLKAGAKMDESLDLLETQWLYYLRIGDETNARVVLDRAVRKGSRNQVLRTQWCIDLINEQMLRRQSFLCSPELAVEVADVLDDLLATNPYSNSLYKLLAQFVPSIIPARPQDRLLLESADRAGAAAHELVEYGLAAWHWRHGDHPEAERRVEALVARGLQGPIAASNVAWLDLQLKVTKHLQMIREWLAEGRSQEAAVAFRELRGLNVSNPALQLEIEAMRQQFDAAQSDG